MNFELQLHQNFKQHKKMETTIDELAAIWHCSPRYAKTQMKLLHERQLVEWETKQGRGKKPFLTLLRAKTDVLLEVIETLWEKSKYDEAFKLIRDFELTMHPKIQQWLHVQFGLQSIQNEHIFRQAMYDVTLCLDPLRALSRHDVHMIEQIHESLFAMDDDGNVHKNLLFHVQSKDFQHWQFILKKGVLFHHMEELTVKDVIASLQAAAPFYSHYFQFEQLDATSLYEFHVTLQKPCALLPHFFASPRFAILPANRNEGIGCGPFSIVINSASQFKLQTFPYYFKERPWIDGVEIVYTEPNQLAHLSPISYKPFSKSIPSQQLIFQENGAEYLVLNGQTGPLNDEELRAAIWRLIQPDQFVNHKYGEQVAYGWTVGSEPFPIQSRNIEPITCPPLTIGYQQIREGASHEREAKIIQQQLATFGIESTLQCINFKEKQQNLAAQLDIFIGGVALGENYLPSLLNTYLNEPQPILSLLSQQDYEFVLQRLERIIEQPSDATRISEIEQFLQQKYCLKFLTHRQHSFYVREDTPFQHVQFDRNGRINYRKIFLSTD
ncbi:MAG: ABC transporter substrate-binding protein [Solibacillus sp.]